MQGHSHFIQWFSVAYLNISTLTTNTNVCFITVGRKWVLKKLALHRSYMQAIFAVKGTDGVCFAFYCCYENLCPVGFKGYAVSEIARVIVW